MEADGLTKPVTRERTFQFMFPDCEKLPPPVLPFIDVSVGERVDISVSVVGEGGFEQCKRVGPERGKRLLPPPVLCLPYMATSSSWPPRADERPPSHLILILPPPHAHAGQLCVLWEGRRLPVPPPRAECGLRFTHCACGA